MVIGLVFDPSAPVRRLGADTVVSRWSLSYEDLTAVAWSEALGRLLVLADAKDRLLVIRPDDGAVESELPIPGQQQEGLAIDGSGALWIADDLDKSLLRIKDAVTRMQNQLRGAPDETPAPAEGGGRRRRRQAQEEGRSLRAVIVPIPWCRRARDGQGWVLDFAVMRLDSYRLRRVSLALLGLLAAAPIAAQEAPAEKDWRVGPGFKVSRPASDFEFGLAGYIQEDFRHFSHDYENSRGELPELGEETVLRRLRVGFDAQWKRLTVELTYDLHDPVEHLKNLSGDIKISKALHVWAGNSSSR
jgi:hypothetical protein